MKPGHLARAALLPVAIAAAGLFGCGQRAESAGENAGTGEAQATYGAQSADAAPKDKAKKDKDAAKSAPSGAFGEGVLSYPDDLQMTMLAYRLTNREPPLSEWASEEYEVRRADEFTKADKLKAETDRLAAIYDATEGAGLLQMRLNSQLSQYDASKGGYYLAVFSPGGTFSFDGKEPVSVQLDNMSEAFFWPMESEQAQEILAQTDRRVTVDAKIRILGTERRTSGLVIKGRLLDYAIYSTRYNDERQLAEFSLE